MKSPNSGLHKAMQMKTSMMARKTSFLCASSLIVFCACSHAQSTAKAGAYESQLSMGALVCVTSAHLADLTAISWEQKMLQSNKECKVTNAETPMAGSERWTATCTEKSGAKLSYRYALQVAAWDGKLMIDSKITDAASEELKWKRGFLGNYKGACAVNTPALMPWDYFDLPLVSVYTPLEEKVRKDTAVELVRCGHILNLMAITDKSGRKAKMQTSAAFMLQSARELFNGDTAIYLAEVDKSATSLQLEFANKTEKQVQTLIASCGNYLLPEGVAQALKSKTASAAQ
jgi:hypothetical protein